MVTSQSNMLNIPTHIEDINYRYKMPKMQLKIEGKGKNIRTNIQNMVEISKSLNVNTEYPLKFIGIEMGSRIIYENNNGDLITSIKGVFQYEELQKYLDKFIQMYVLCTSCSYPEMQLRIKGDKKQASVEGKCNACGHRSKLDNNHQLANYMIKNKPIKIKEMKDEGQKSQTSNLNEETKTEETIKVQDKSKEIKLLGANDLTLESQKLADLVELMKENYKEQKSKLESESDKQKAKDIIFQELNMLQIDRSLQDRFFYILFNSIFTTDFNDLIQKGDEKSMLPCIGTELKLNVKLLDNKRFGEENMIKEIIMNLQHMLFVKNDKAKCKQYVPSIIKFFYDHEDLIDNNKYLMSWFQNKTDFSDHFLYHNDVNKEFIEAATPFMNWIAQQEDDEDENQEEDVNVDDI